MYELRELDSMRHVLPTETHATYADALRSAHLGIDFGNAKEIIVEVSTGQVLFRWEV